MQGKKWIKMNLKIQINFIIYYMNEIFDIIDFTKKYYNNFIFYKDDSVDVKLNKTIMFLIYTLIIFIIIGSKFGIVPLSLIGAIIFIKIFYKKEYFEEKKKCRKPTNDNPFMNPLFEADKLEACDATEREVLDKYYHNLNRNINDVFEKKTSQQYYKTNNVTTIPNKYGNFLKYIGMTYDQPDNNCKYDGVKCLAYNDLRIR